MPFRRTSGILGDATDPKEDARVIMTAAILGFAASYLQETLKPIRFDMDPLDGDPNNRRKGKDYSLLAGVIEKIQLALRIYFQLPEHGPQVNLVEWGFTPDYATGGVIMGVYESAGQTPPVNLTRPVFFECSTPDGKRVSYGKVLYEGIRDLKLPHYAGRGAYTGFVDNPSGPPIGPLPTARFKVPVPGSLTPDPYPRWLPPFEDTRSYLWEKRKRFGADALPGHIPECDHYVPWGLIGGDNAHERHAPTEAATEPYYVPPPGFQKNEADFTTANMYYSRMRFNDALNAQGYPILFKPGPWGYASDYIAAYTHGMIQAIYKAYHLGPQCRPYEIAVGDKTKKLASCIPCTLFMYALGYPPTSIHLGRGESWAPLYAPYSPDGRQDTGTELAVIRDLNNQWYQKCFKWLVEGVRILDVSKRIKPDYQRSLTALRQYLAPHIDDKSGGIPTVGGVLILDALTIHEAEVKRIDETLR